MLRERGDPELKQFGERKVYLAEFLKREGLTAPSEAFFRRFVEICAGPNGVFGVKLFNQEFKFLANAASQLFSARGPGLRERMEACFPNLRYIYLRREAALDQAVSLCIAHQTQQWCSDHRAKAEPEFDFEAIDRRYNMLLEGEKDWQSFFARHGIEPLRLTYDELRADYDGCILRTLAHLGIELPPGVPIRRPAMKKQATRLNREWVERYLELKGRSAAR